MNDQQVGGIFDDIQTLAEFRPLLPMVRKLQAASTISDRFVVLAEIAEFASLHLFKTDARRKRWVAVLRLAAETAKSDPRWQTVISDLFK